MFAQDFDMPGSIIITTYDVLLFDKQFVAVFCCELFFVAAKNYWIWLEMHGEIFHFEIFKNFNENFEIFQDPFFEIFQDPFFEIFHETFNFQY